MKAPPWVLAVVAASASSVLLLCAAVVRSIGRRNHRGQRRKDELVGTTLELKTLVSKAHDGHQHLSPSDERHAALTVHLMPLQASAADRLMAEVLGGSLRQLRCCREGVVAGGGGVDGKNLVIGLDCEWQPENRVKGKCGSFGNSSADGHHPISVIQLSTASDCFLFRPLLMTPAGVTKGLRCLLEDAAVIKAGVGIIEDVKRIQRDFGVGVRVRR